MRPSLPQLRSCPQRSQSAQRCQLARMCQHRQSCSQRRRHCRCCSRSCPHRTAAEPRHQRGSTSLVGKCGIRSHPTPSDTCQDRRVSRLKSPAYLPHCLASNLCRPTGLSCLGWDWPCRQRMERNRQGCSSHVGCCRFRQGTAGRPGQRRRLHLGSNRPTMEETRTMDLWEGEPTYTYTCIHTCAYAMRRLKPWTCGRKSRLRSSRPKIALFATTLALFATKVPLFATTAAACRTRQAQRSPSAAEWQQKPILHYKVDRVGVPILH